MSKTKIISALKAKGYTPLDIQYQRSCPVPEGYASGWDLEFDEATEELVYKADWRCKFTTFMEFDNLKAVMDWVDTLPTIKIK